MHWLPIHSIWIGMQTIGMDTNGFVAGGGVDAARSVATWHGRMTTVGSAGENPSSGALWARRGQANDGQKVHLRTSVRCAIISSYRAVFYVPESLSKSRLRRLLHDHRRQRPADRPSPTGTLSAGSARRRPGAWPTPWSPSSPTTPAASTPPSGGCSTTGAPTWVLRPLPAEPLTVARYLAGPRRLRRQHRHHAPGYIRHHQGPRVGRLRIAL